MQPSQDMGARMLTALVLHVVIAFFSNKKDPLLKPFVSILDTPATMVVSCIKLCTKTNAYVLQQVHGKPLFVIRENTYQQCLKTF